MEICKSPKTNTLLTLKSTVHVLLINHMKFFLEVNTIKYFSIIKELMVMKITALHTLLFVTSETILSIKFFELIIVTVYKMIYN